MRFDIFCNVIDNHGDVGVCWRLARELAARGDAVRLWIDDASALAWMAPAGAAGVEILDWAAAVLAQDAGDAVIEAFGCNPPAAFVDLIAARGSVWINLEYLSAEPYVARCHGLRSPVRPGLEKVFFYPGFSPATGGLLRERGLEARHRAFDAAAWLQARGIPAGGARLVSLFCYEPPKLGELVAQLVCAPSPTHLLVTAGRATQALRSVLPADTGALEIHWLPLLSQPEYDHLLWACDFNFVRGEDSWVRAILAGKPFAWQAYPQADAAHFAKVDAFLEWLQPPASLRDFFLAWNGETTGALPPLDPTSWRATAQAARARASALPELATGLQQFVCERGRI